jgi:hypothetical protein
MAALDYTEPPKHGQTPEQAAFASVNLAVADTVQESPCL